jgi:magnesium-transporting ATPase (P-type)
MDRESVQPSEKSERMSTRRVMWLWLLVAVLALATIVVGTVAGYQADEASVLPDGEAALSIPQWGAALWTLVGATVVAGVWALAVTAVRARPVDGKRIVAPAAVIVAGLLAGAVVFLPFAVLSIFGAAWPIARLVGTSCHRATT